MAKHKLQRFSENLTFGNVFQPQPDEGLSNSFPLKGKWNAEYFKNSNSIVLELGCGKGEYTVGLAQKFLNKNFIGVDIKGARLWRGAKTAWESKMTNVAFVRTRIEFLSSFFDEGEADEIWITFPDPQPNKAKKRLTSPRFLNLYKNVLKDSGIVNLKTDNLKLYEYSLEVVSENNLEIIENTKDLYASAEGNEILLIKTFYEEKFLAEGIPIKYLRFKLPKNGMIKDVKEKAG